MAHCLERLHSVICRSCETSLRGRWAYPPSSFSSSYSARPINPVAMLPKITAPIAPANVNGWRCAASCSACSFASSCVPRWDAFPTIVLPATLGYYDLSATHTLSERKRRGCRFGIRFRHRAQRCINTVRCATLQIRALATALQRSEGICGCYSA